MNGISQESVSTMLDEFFQMRPLVGNKDFSRECIAIDFSIARHERPRPLTDKKRSVYMFFMNDTWMKIGQTAYSPRYTSQHYNPKGSGSNLARSILKHSDYLGVRVEEAEIGQWIQNNMGRVNILFPESWGPRFSTLLEAYLLFVCRPVFEGKIQD